MELIPNSAAAYRAAHYRKLMVLTALRNISPTRDEFCRISSVETLAPGLWVTATFLDGSIRRFRPEKIRDATPDEEQLANASLPANVPAPV
jgi:hypothetical protein